MKTTTIAFAIVTGFLLTSVARVQAQDSGQLPIWVWYVKRSTTQFTTGHTYTSTWGPYNSQAQAEQVRDQLNQQSRTFGTSSSGTAYIVKQVNPLIQPGTRPVIRKRVVQPFPLQQQRVNSSNQKRGIKQGSGTQSTPPRKPNPFRRRRSIR